MTTQFTSTHQEIIQLLKQCQNITDPEKTIDAILKAALSYYQADRAYIFEADDELLVGRNTYEVCAPGVTSEMKNLQNIPFDQAPRWQKAFLNKEPLFVDGLASLEGSNQGEYDILSPQDIQTLMAVPFNRRGFGGYIGVDNPKKHHKETEGLQLFGCLVAMQLVERHLDQDLVSTKKSKFIRSKDDIYVQTFGVFEIDTFLGNYIANSAISKQCFSFLAYLLLNKNKFISVQRLTNVIWPDTDIAAPYDYIRNVAFRTRQIFKSFIGRDFIVAKNGSYMWNSQLNTTTDYECIDRLLVELDNCDNLEGERKE